MAQVEFLYEGNIITIKCQEDQKVADIFDKFISKSNIKENEIKYYYDDKIVSQNDKYLTFNQISNQFDKSNKKMKIIVKSDGIYDDNINKDKNIIFPGGEIKLKIKIEEDDVGEHIYYLDNTDGEVRVMKNKELKYEEHHHDFLKELNELNVELYINGEEDIFKKYFIPKEEGEYDILLKLKILMKDCSFMFFACSNLTNIDLSSFNTKNTTNMYWMFYGCSNLTNIDLFSFNTENVTNMSWMFRGCSNLTNLDLSSFNTDNVKYMSYMFAGCSRLTNIDLSSISTKNVIDMSNMFSGCSKLANIDLSSFNTNNVTNMSFMFFRCSNLTNIDLSSFNTDNVTDISYMFRECSNLTNIDLYSFNTKSVTNISHMFGYCSHLSYIDLYSFNTNNVTKMSNILYGCPYLKRIRINRVHCKNLVNEINKNLVKKIEFCENIENNEWSGKLNKYVNF